MNVGVRQARAHLRQQRRELAGADALARRAITSAASNELLISAERGPPQSGVTACSSSRRRGQYAGGGCPDSPLYTAGVDPWYTIGLCLGLGLGIGVVLAGLLAVNRLGTGAAAVIGVAAGAVVGLGIGEIEETVAGGTGGFMGALAAGAVVQGAMRRGATRLGIAAYLGAAGALLLLLAFVPAVGYLAFVALPVLAVRMRGRQAARYAGLRTLAK